MADEINAVGIDLGTTYSSLAIVDNNGRPFIVPNSDSERLTPSAVFFDDDAIIVGQSAKDAAIRDPDHVVMFVKRQMGNPSWYVAHKGQRHTATDISAMILAKLKRDAEAYLNHPVENAVITVPYYFDDERRRATQTAGRLAGLNVLCLVNEPTAAAVAFGTQRALSDEMVLVFDMGGGTLDVTLMQVGKSNDFHVKATDGYFELGGKDFDDEIMRYAVSQFAEKHGFDPTSDPLSEGEMRLSAERAKRELSKRERTEIIIRSQGRLCRVPLERRLFSQLIKPKLATAMSIVKSALNDANVAPSQIDRVVLVGGSTRVPALRTALAGYFGRQPDYSINPDEAVALGAAIIASQKASESQSSNAEWERTEVSGGLRFQVEDVVSHSIGIEASVPGTRRRFNAILLPRNTPIPGEVSKIFETTEPGQTSIRVTVYQGEHRETELCRPIGEFRLVGLPPRPPGSKVRVTIMCDSDGVVKVSAVDIESGKQTTTEVSYRSGQPSSKSTLNPKELWIQGANII